MPVSVTIDGRSAVAAPGRSLYECAESLGVRVPTSCHSQGKCRECLVELDVGDEWLTPRSEEELGLDETFRLSCRARVVGEAGEVRCHTLKRGALQIEEAAHGVTSVETPDAAVHRAGSAVVCDGRVLAADAERLLGVAIDLGTTTVVARLADLETGEKLAAQSFENPQRFGGSDVMARILYDTEHPGRLLQRTLLGYLTHALEGLPAEPESIFEVVVVGNTTMRDLFFGLDVHSVGQHPYRSTTEEAFRRGERASTSLEATGKKLRLPVHPEARVYGAPLIGSHLGADAAAGLLATDMANGSELCALIDIGTNTEIVLGNRERILAASCPAGPAFEGRGIACGMPAMTGAIERVRLLANGTWEVQVIGGGEPQGICGSGLVDLLSELLRTGRMNAQGRFEEEGERIVVDAARGIVLEERDVSELAQAKGANVAGLRVLLDEYGVALEDIERLYLAGGFARHLDVDAARAIGLVPNVATERIFCAGNVAVEGATQLLLSASRRAELEALVQRVEHVELEVHEGFFDFFVEGCQYEPVEGRGA